MDNVEKKLDKIIDLLSAINRAVSSIDDTCDDIEDHCDDSVNYLEKIKDRVKETSKAVKKMEYVETFMFDDYLEDGDECDEEDDDDYDDEDDHDFTRPRPVFNILNHVPSEIEIKSLEANINELVEKLKMHDEEDAADDLVRLSSEATSVLDSADDNIIGYALIAEYTKLVSLWYLYSELLNDREKETEDKFVDTIKQRWCFSDYNPSQDYDNKEALKEGFEEAYNNLKNMLSHMNEKAQAEVEFVDELSRPWFRRLNEATIDVSIARAKMKLAEILDMYENKLMSGVFDNETDNATESDKTGSVLYDLWAKTKRQQDGDSNE